MKMDKQAWYSCDITSIATCWKIILKNKRVLSFTDSSSDISINGIVYQAKSGISRKAFENNITIEKIANVEVEGMLDHESINENDIKEGQFDNALVEIFLVDYNNPQENIIFLHKGYIAEIHYEGNRFIADIQGIAAKTDYHVGEVFSEFCRACFGDSRCKVDVKSFAVQAKVARIVDAKSIEISIIPDENFSSIQIGWNKYEIEFIENNIIKLATTPTDIILQDQEILLIPTCDKSYNTCKNKYKNIINFRAEPFV